MVILQRKTTPLNASGLTLRRRTDLFPNSPSRTTGKGALTFRTARARFPILPQKQRVVAIVDDEEAVGRALARLLRAAGYAVELFAGGAEFLESSVTPDCLVLDVYMLRTNGSDVLVNLIRRGRHIPTVLITGSVEDDIELPAGPARTYPVLQKPVDDQDLLDAVAAAILRGPLPDHGT